MNMMSSFLYPVGAMLLSLVILSAVLHDFFATYLTLLLGTLLGLMVYSTIRKRYAHLVIESTILALILLFFGVLMFSVSDLTPADIVMGLLDLSNASQFGQALILTLAAFCIIAVGATLFTKFSSDVVVASSTATKAKRPSLWFVAFLLLTIPAIIFGVFLFYLSYTGAVFG